MRVPSIRLLMPFVAAGVLSGWVVAVPGAASEQLERQLDIRPANRTQGQSRDVADRLLRLGREEAAASDYATAIDTWYRAIEIYALLGDYRSAGMAYDYIGLTYAQLGRYTEAEDTLRRRLAVAQDAADLLGQVYGWNNLGSVFIQGGNLRPAQEAFQRGLVIAEDVQDNGGIGLSLSNLGLVSQLQGNLNDARKYYEAATNYRYRAGDLAGEANSNNNLGEIYRRLGEEGKALGAFLVARDTAQRGGDFGNHIRALDGLIDIYSDRGELTEVRRFLDERIALTSSPNATPAQRLGTLIRLGRYYEQLGELRAAEATYQQALNLAQQLEDGPAKGELYNRIYAIQRQNVN